MTTIYPAPKLVYVSPDGDGGWRLTITARDGTTYVQPLDLKLTTTLIQNLCHAFQGLTEKT